MRARLLLPLLVAGLAGCTTENHASVFVAMLCSAPSDAQACSYAAKCNAESIGETALDVSVSNFHFAALQVNNQATSNKNAQIGQLNTHDAWIESYTVSYQNLPYAKFSKEVLGTAYVPVEGTAVIGIRPIPEAIGDAIVADGLVTGSYRDIVATIRLYGRWGDGSHFETGEFLLPMRICDGTGCVPAELSGAACPTVGDLRYTCPAMGQVPASTKCVAP